MVVHSANPYRKGATRGRFTVHPVPRRSGVTAKLDIGLIAGASAPMPGAELDLALLAGLVAVLLLGPGRPSLDHMLNIEGIKGTVPGEQPATSVQ